MKHRLEKQRFAKSGKARPRRSATKGRYIPADIRRTVWDRDGGQCTFVSDNGKRCDSRKRLEYDHIEAVARGGQTTVNGIRLLCRAHNQLTAECTFGAGFMQGKRELSKCRAARAKAQADAQPQAVSGPG